MQHAGPLIIGVTEPVAFPELGLERLFAKIDSGADYSTLHALSPCLVEGAREVEFTPPFWRNQPSPEAWRGDGLRRVRAPLLERRWVRNSSGAQEERFVIETEIVLGLLRMRTGITLASRSGMRTPALIGRLTLASAPRTVHIDPGAVNLTLSTTEL